MQTTSTYYYHCKKWMMVLCVGLCSLAHPSISQPIGSGGVGDLSENRFWLTSSTLQLPNGASVDNWPGIGGNGTPPTQTNATQQPLFVANQLNGHGVIAFDGTNDYLDIASNIDLDDGGPYEERTFHFLFRTSSDTSSRQVLYQEGGTSRGLNMYIFNGRLYFAAWNIPNDGAGAPWTFDSTSVAINANTAYYLSYIYDGNATSTGTITGYLNGTLFGTITGVGRLYNHNNATIGAKINTTIYETGNSGGNGEYFEGDVAEMIIYNYAHNDAERIVIENYLTAKYAISTTVNDIYTMDAPGNGDYDSDMAGIGRESATAQNNDAQGRNPFRIMNPSGMTDGEYMLWGHDGADASVTSNNTDIPAVGGISSRIDRVWRVTQSGTIDSVDVNFDTECNVYSSDSIYLLVDTDNDGTFSDETAGVGVFGMNDLGSGLFGLSGISVLDNGTRFTFGFDGQAPDTYVTVPGPGGIGDNSVNRFWFDANTLGLADGASVQTWSNLGGNTLDFNQGTASQRPTLDSNHANGMPFIVFDGTNDHLDLNDNSDLNTGGPWSERSYFVVFNTGNDTSNRQVIYEEGGGTRGLNTYLFNGQIHVSAWNLNSDSPNTPWGFSYVSADINANTDYILSFVYRGNDCRTGTIRVYLNGSEIGVIPQLGWFYVHTGDIALGAQQNDSYYENGSSTGDGMYFEGSIGEFIIYNNAINETQRIIVENYLSGKYGIALDSNDIYNMDNGGNGDYDFEIAGIGRLNGFEEDNDSQGRAIMRVRNPTDLNDDEFLMWGHSNGEAQATETVDVPAGVEARFERAWRMNEINSSGSAIDVGSVDLLLDLSGLGNITPSDLRLLIDDNGNGLFADDTPISGATDLGGGIYAFQNISGIQNGNRLTIGTADISQTPLPITLIEFNALIENQRIVELNWQTASEQNNDYFTVERSSDGSHWENIQTVDGAGTSSTTMEYQTFDLSPLHGRSYYRLQQTDFDGGFTYSEPESVEFDDEPIEINIFPNPTSHSVKLLGGAIKPQLIRVFNALGQDVTAHTVIHETANYIISLDLSKLGDGIYHINTGTAAYTILKH